jgi:hypothetical protein
MASLDQCDVCGKVLNDGNMNNLQAHKCGRVCQLVAFAQIESDRLSIKPWVGIAALFMPATVMPIDGHATIKG